MYCNPFYQREPDFKTLYIFGAGGFGREVAWLAEQCWGTRVKRIFVVDDRYLPSGPVNDIEILTPSALHADATARFVVAVGSGVARRHAADELTACGLLAVAIVHPRAEMSSNIQLGGGAIVCAGNFFTTNVHIGEHVHVNLNCTLGHDVHVGDFSTLSPGVHVSGHVHIGQNVFIGTGANIINGSVDTPLTIGDGAVVAAGACVTRSVSPSTMVAGVPAVRKR